MVQKRNIVVCLLLSIVTCGIYGIYWFICINNDMNTAYPDEYTTSGGMAFLLTLVTCGIYGLYWMYKMGSKIDKKENNGNNAILFLILSAIGLGVVNYCIIQDKLNNCSTIS